MFTPGVYHDWNKLVEDYTMPTRKNRPVQRATRQPIRRVTRVVTVKKNSKSNIRRQKSNSGYDFNRVFSDIASTITRALSNPLVLLTIALSIGVIVTHDFSAKKGFIYDTFKDRNDTVSKWIVDHGMKFAGMLMFLPSVIDSPKRIRSVVALVAFLWIMVIPEASASEYFLQSLALHTYFKLSNNNSRLTVLVIILLAWFLGYLKISKK